MTWKSFQEIYENIGRFCVDFEQLCRSMEACIRNVLHQQGLTNESVQSIILSGYTAEPLRRLLQNLIGEVIGNDGNKKILSKVFVKIQELIQERNDLIHSKWFVFGNLQKDEEVAEFLAIGEKLHANQHGEAVKKFNLKKDELEKLLQECREASIVISLLTRCILGFRAVEECFFIDKDTLVVNYEALKPIEKTV